MDGLGSARELHNSAGHVIENQRYVMSPSGVGTSSYGFAGEWTDGTGLEYLRSRYYSPQPGRFTTKDVWEGDALRPLSLNKWNYVVDNPVNRIDPSGLIDQGNEEQVAEGTLIDLSDTYNVKVQKDWFRGWWDEYPLVPVYIRGIRLPIRKQDFAESVAAYV